jgi:Family of unknown function (DUF6335)
MAKRKAPRRAKTSRSKPPAKRRSVKRQTKRSKPARTAKHPARRRPARAARGRKAAAAAVKGTAKPGRPTPRARARTPASRSSRKKRPRLDRERRVLNEPTPPSSLDMDRHGSAAGTGRHELQHSLLEHTGMTPALTGGDVDADWENAYFSGDEAPGGDNPTPDQDRVDDIGRSIGLQYDDNEELKGDEKVVERDKHRWELDPASSEDYRDRK